MKYSLATIALISNASAASIERRAIPDGYTHNNKVLSDSILETHTNAETARAAAVAKQEASDVWRAGSTPNSGPVINYAQVQNPADADTYATTTNTLGDSLKERQDKYYARVLWGNEQQVESDAWRAVPWTATQKDLGLAAMQLREIPDGHTKNHNDLSDSILKTHTDAETARQASVDKQEAADVWRKGFTPNSGPVTHPYGLVQQREIPDGHTHNHDVLSDSILKAHTDAETARQAAVDKQEAADAWRKGSTPNSGPVLSLAQHRAIPDGHTYNHDVLSDSVLKAHTDAETARQAAVDKQEAADAWRKGSTPNSGPVINYVQRTEIPDGYTFNNGKLANSILETHTNAETARAAAVAKQEAADAWRAGSTPNSGPVLSLNQYRNPADADTYATTTNTLGDSLKERQDKYYARVLWGNQQQEESDAWRAVPYTPTQKDLGLAAMQRNAIPDGYTHNNKVLSDSILETHTNAETARAAAVAKQEAADVWRAGSTPNSGPVINYAQHGNPADHDTYGTNVNDRETGLVNWSDGYEGKRTWGISEQARQDEWRAVPYVTPESAWSGVSSLAQGQPGPNPTDQDYHFKTLNDKINTHNQIWYDEQQADVAKQAAVDAWRDGYTANTGPELPYTM